MAEGKMTRSNFFILFISIILFLSSFAYGARPWEESEGKVLVFYDQLSTGLSDEQCQFVAERAYGTQKVPLSFINRIRAYNPDFLLLHYELSFGAGDLLNLEGESWVADWDSVTPHENWFLHNCSSGRCRQTDWDWYFMDPSGTISGAGSNGWKEYWARRAIRRMRLNDCDGIFSDSHIFPWNMDSYPCHFSYDFPESMLALGPHFVAFDNYQMSRLHSGDSIQYKYIPNVGMMITGWDTTDYSHCDGAMIEIFSMYDCWNNFEPEDWVLEVNRVLRLAGMNKILIFQNTVDYPDDTTAARCRLWLVANYFIMKNSKSYLNLMDTWCYDGQPNYWPEYSLNLGGFDGTIPNSAAEMFNATMGAYVRYYERGMVIVNNSWAPVSISFPARYFRLSCNGGGCVGDAGEIVPVTYSYSPTTGFSLLAMNAAIVTYDSGTVGIAENLPANEKRQSLFTVYLAGKSLKINGSGKPFDGSVKICDITGRIVSSGNCLKGFLELPAIPRGVYFAVSPGFPPARFVMLR
jgi:hypothetical protein